MKFKGILFDLDGTLVDSNDAVDRAWMTWCKRNGIDFAVASEVYHGRPAAETIRQLMQGCSEHKVAEEIAWLQHQESTDVEGVIALPGTIEFLNELNRNSVPWAIVTSGTLPVAKARIDAAGIPRPELLITPELVTKGKPDPEPYLLGAAGLGLMAEECVVFEDAPSGLTAGIDAGARTVAVLSQFSKQALPEADRYIDNLSSLDVELCEEGYNLIFTNDKA